MKQVGPGARLQRLAGSIPPPVDFTDSGLEPGVVHEASLDAPAHDWAMPPARVHRRWRAAATAANDVASPTGRAAIPGQVRPAGMAWWREDASRGDATLIDEVSLELLDRANVAAFAVRADAQVVLATPRTADLVSGMSSAFMVTQGRLRLRCAIQQRRLAELIESALRAPEAARQRLPRATTVARDGQLPLTITVCAAHAPRRLSQREPLALVIVRDPERMEIDLEVLKSCFGFTGTEAAVARYLAAGKSVEQIAALQSVSVATVRSQVNKLLLKTHTKRQGELISVILRSVGAAAAC